MDASSQVFNVSLIPALVKQEILRTKFVGPNVIITEVTESSAESIIIPATVSISCVILIIVLYCCHLYKWKRATIPVSTREYFTRPRRPMIFLDELESTTSSNSEYPIFWQRPLHPISIDKDLYCVVTRY